MVNDIDLVETTQDRDEPVLSHPGSIDAPKRRWPWGWIILLNLITFGLGLWLGGQL